MAPVTAPREGGSDASAAFRALRAEAARAAAAHRRRPAELGARTFYQLLLAERPGKGKRQARAARPGVADAMVEENNLYVQISSRRKLLGPGDRGPSRGYRLPADGASMTAPQRRRPEPLSDRWCDALADVARRAPQRSIELNCPAACRTCRKAARILVIGSSVCNAAVKDRSSARHGWPPCPPPRAAASFTDTAHGAPRTAHRPSAFVQAG